MIKSAPTQGNNLVHTASGRPSATSSVCAPWNISIEDWDILFRAVEERLRRMVDERHTVTSHPRMNDLRGSVQETVLECIAALDQLHAALTHERELYYQLEPDVRDIQAARGQSRVELVDAHSVSIPHNHRVSTM